jgi:hypothetical protein
LLSATIKQELFCSWGALAILRSEPVLIERENSYLNFLKGYFLNSFFKFLFMELNYNPSPRNRITVPFEDLSVINFNGGEATKRVFENARLIQKDFLEPLQNAVSGKKLFYGNRFYSVKKIFEKEHVYNYLGRLTPEERKRASDFLGNFNENQLAIFLDSLRLLSKSNSKTRLSNEALRIKEGKLTRIFSANYAKFCPRSFAGFLRAVNESSLRLGVAEIEGKKRPVLIKTPIGRSSDPKLNQGFHTLFLDPQTMKVYTFKTDSNGKIVSYRVPYGVSETQKIFFSGAERSVLLKEFHDYFVRAYGEMRGKKMFQKMFSTKVPSHAPEEHNKLKWKLLRRR